MTSGQSEELGISPLLAIEGAAALLSAIVASSSDAILRNSLQGTITSWNAATAKLFGYSASEMIGQSIGRIIPAGRDMVRSRAWTAA